MNKKKRLAMSQAAHRRLSRKYFIDMQAGKDAAWIKGTYHGAVESEQRKKHEILSRDQKGRIYDRVIKDYWN